MKIEKIAICKFRYLFIEEVFADTFYCIWAKFELSLAYSVKTHIHTTFYFNVEFEFLS